MTGAGPRRCDELVTAVPKRAWQPLLAGSGAKGERVYEVGLDQPARAGEHPAWLLVAAGTRPPAHRPTTAAAPHRVSLGELVRVAGRRWCIEELTGLDQHQVRRWTSWRRCTLLALLAVLTAETRHRPPTAGLIPLTCAETHRLLLALYIEPGRQQACPEPGRTGDDATNTAPKPATTSDIKPSIQPDNDLWLEY